LRDLNPADTAQALRRAAPAADPVGHYSRPDVFQLLSNPRPNRVVVSGERREEEPPVEVTEPSDLVPVDGAPLERV
jgi:aliphatic nitrilase